MQMLLVSILSVSTLFVTLPPSDWKPYSSSEGKFSVSMPEEPRSTTMLVETERGRLFTHIVSASDRDLNEYMVSWTDYNKDVEYKSTEKTFERMRDALIQSKEGKLISESPVSLSGRAGRAFAFTDRDGRTVNVRFFFVGQRSYQVQVESRTSENLADADRFLKSFRVQD